MVGFTENNRGRYKCKYCDHHTYKTWGGANNHVEQNHPLELERDKAIARAEYAEKAKETLSRQLAEATKPKPQPKSEKKYWYIQNGGGIYCESCKIVQMGVGIPEGQTIENTPHNCGNRTLKLVLEVR